MPTETRGKKARTCPNCGSKLIPIAYGLPSPGMVEESEKGRIALGGCVLEEPTHRCSSCDAEFTRAPYSLPGS
jgi:hypothetical protein